MSPGVPLLAALIVALCGVSCATDSGLGSAVYSNRGVVVVEGSFDFLLRFLGLHQINSHVLCLPFSSSLLHTLTGAKEVVISNAATGQNFTVTEHMELVEQFSEAQVTIEATRVELADTKAVVESMASRIGVLEGMSAKARPLTHTWQAL